MIGMDPHEVLGIHPGAGPEEVARAYRALAKRLHPDRRPDDVAAALMMREVNAAYAALSGVRRGSPAPGAPPAPAARPRRTAATWLEPRIRRALGSELLAVLEPQEPILVVTDAATSDAFSVRLAVSDRRLIWLRDDAPTDRVRSLRFRGVEHVEGRLKGRRRPRGLLTVHPRDGRKLTFAELEPAALREVLAASRRAVAAA